MVATPDALSAPSGGNKMIRQQLPFAGLVLLVATSSSLGAETTVLEGAIVTLIEHVDVPARALGPVAEWKIHEGDVVKAGDLLGKVDDAEAALTAERAATELTVARRDAANELPILAATKGAEAARAELKRAVESTTKYEKSVSQSEMDRLKLAADEADLKQRQAVHVRESAELAARVKENELATARLKLQLHQVTAPISGVVVEMKRRVGEWVEPGMPVVRLVRMDRLRAEAFSDVGSLPPNAVGRAVELRLVGIDGAAAATYVGRITFVHPEVNPVNGQVRLWAEMENRDGALRPGMQGTLTVLPAQSALDQGDAQGSR